MPYKHIAAHLKKTELACRLHFHQLSHGSNRRKRTASVCSSTSSMVSPVMGNTLPSPIHEYNAPPSHSPSNYNQIQLPSASSLLPRSNTNSPPRLNHQPILPKPAGPRRSLSEATINTPPLRLNCAFPSMAPYQNAPQSVNQPRLHAIYSNHRNSFWNAIALDYGDNIAPAILEAAFLASASHAGLSPPTPSLSPNTTPASTANRGNGFSVKDSYGSSLPTPVENNKASGPSISALLGIDASPRSPKERELIKRMEEGRDIVMGGIEN